jgi:hypothetical protein
MNVKRERERVSVCCCVNGVCVCCGRDGEECVCCVCAKVIVCVCVCVCVRGRSPKGVKTKKFNNSEIMCDYVIFSFKLMEKWCTEIVLCRISQSEMMINFLTKEIFNFASY